MKAWAALLVLAPAIEPITAWAQAHDDPCACSASKPGFMRRAQLTGDWGGDRTWLEDHGLTISPSYAAEVFASPGLAHPAVIAGLGALALDYARGGFSAHAVGFGIHGSGLDDQLMDIYGVSNNVADPDVRLFEAWADFESHGAGGRAGLLAADQEFDLAAHGTVLMNATFGVIGMISTDILGPVYPVATPGVSLRYARAPVTARAAVYDGDQINEHGMPTHIGDSALAIGEVELWRTVKLGGWIHTARPDGLYVVADRGLGGRLGAFARVGVSPAGPIEIYADAGVRGPPGRFRPTDFCGLGASFVRTVIDGSVHHQGVIEGTYQVGVTGWFTVQPDVQVVFTPERTSLVGAVRATIAF